MTPGAARHPAFSRAILSRSGGFNDAEGARAVPAVQDSRPDDPLFTGYARKKALNESSGLFYLFDAWQFMNHAVIHPSGRCFAAFKSVRFCPTLLSSELPEVTCRSFNLMPGSSLLSHGETPHYHRRYGVSLLSSAWGQVGPPRYSRQANSLFAEL